MELSSRKGVEAPNIEIEVEDCEEYAATFIFYVISGSDLSQVHMVVENLGATGVIPMKEDETAPRRAKTPRMEGVRAMI